MSPVPQLELPSEDALKNGDGISDAAGDATFKVSVDGKQLGGTFTSTASHAAGASQRIPAAAKAIEDTTATDRRRRELGFVRSVRLLSHVETAGRVHSGDHAQGGLAEGVIHHRTDYR